MLKFISTKNKNVRKSRNKVLQPFQESNLETCFEIKDTYYVL